MSDTSYSRWYHTGTISLSKNSPVVTGANTYWLNAGLKPGDLFTIDDSKFYEIQSVDSNIQLTLCKPFAENPVSAATYSIIRNFTATLPAEIAAKNVECLAKYNRYIDEDMKTVQGKSAYELACDNGYTGSESDWLDTLNAYGVAKKNGFVGTVSQWLESLTAYGRAKDNGFSGSEAEWLESLIGAGQWASLNERTKLFINDGIGKRVIHNSKTYAGLHNSIARGKCLGDHITDEQWAAIKNGTYDDMWIGDWWDFNFGSKIDHLCARYYIMAFDACKGNSSNKGVTEDKEGTQLYLQDVSNFNALNSNSVTGITDEMLGAPEDMTHVGGHIMLWNSWDYDIPEALCSGVKEYNSLQRLVSLNPLSTWKDAPDPAPDYSCPGRTDPDSAFNKKKNFFKEFFGENHLAYVPLNAVSEFDEETNSPTAFKVIREFYDVIPMTFIYGYYPGEMAEKYKNFTGILYNYQMPLWRFIPSLNYYWSASTREHATLRYFYHIGNGKAEVSQIRTPQTFISLR